MKPFDVNWTCVEAILNLFFYDDSRDDRKNLDHFIRLALANIPCKTNVPSAEHQSRAIKAVQEIKKQFL